MSIMSMTERVELEKGSRKVSEVKELNCDNSKASEIEGLTDQFESLEQLSIVNVGLQSLSALPALLSLKKIDLADNRLSANLEPLSKCPKLEQINMSGNEIKTVETIAPLKELKSLRVLDLSNCPVTETEKYRQEVFELIPHLQYLDGFDINMAEEPVEDLTNGDGETAATNGEKAKKTGEDVTASGDENEDFEDDYDEDEDDDDEEDDEDEEEEEEDKAYGLAALRDSAELEDDEEDYVPAAGEDEDEEIDDEDLDEEDAALEAEAADESGVANLSAAGVTGSRRAGAVKRRQSDAQPNGIEEENADEGEAEAKKTEDATEPASKKPALEADETGDSNGTPAEV